MKKIVIYTLFSIIYLAVSWLAYHFFSGSNLLMLFITLMSATLVLLFGGNFLLSFDGKTTVKLVIIRAVALAVIACLISVALLTVGQTNHTKTSPATEIVEEEVIEEDSDVEWETSISEQDISSRVMQTGFDFFIALLGGLSAVKLQKNKSGNHD